jgi:N-methylhydantoinase B
MEHRGGCGTSYGFTAWSEMVTSVLGDRVDHPPFGVNGGGNAAPNEVRLRIDGVTSEPPMRGKANQVQLRPGDAVMVKSPGGAGFGDPLQRPLYRVLEDLNLGFISEASASEHYGAVIAGRELVAGRWRFTLDEAASNALRTSRLSGS